MEVDTVANDREWKSYEADLRTMTTEELQQAISGVIREIGMGTRPENGANYDRQLYSGLSVALCPHDNEHERRLSKSLSIRRAR